MTKRKMSKTIIILLILTCLACLVLAGCESSPKVTSIKLSEGSVYKTVYGVNEQLSLEGLTIEVTKSDNTKEKVKLTDIAEQLKIYNFTSAKEVENLTVVVEYLNMTVSFNITVSNEYISDNKVKVTFITNSSTAIEPLLVNQFSKIEKPADPTRDNYIFEGWYKETTLTNTWNFLADKVDKDTVLYAKWAPMFTYSFYDEEGNFLVDKKIKHGGTLVDIPAVPSIEGKIGEWDIASFDNVVSNKIIRPIYSDQTFTVAFYAVNDRGQRYVFDSQTVIYGQDAIIPLKNPTRSHYVFKGWVGSYQNIRESATIEAKFEKEKYNVYFNLGEGAFAPEELSKYKYDEGKNLYYQAIDYEYYVSENKNLIREGFVFEGWYADAAFTNKYTFNNSVVVDEFTLFAKWTELFALHFYADGVEIQGSPVMVKKGMEGTPLAVPYKEGYVGKWSMTDYTNIQQNYQINAIYTILSYNVRFVGDDGTEIKIFSGTDAIPYGTNIETFLSTKAPMPPKKTGYTFEFWQHSILGVDEIKENFTFTAKYMINKYNVTFINQNLLEISKASYDYNALVEKPAEPIFSEGNKLFRFDNWYKDKDYKTVWNFLTDKVGDTDISLYAKFVEQVTVTFVGANDDGTDIVLRVDKGGRLTSKDIPKPPMQEGKEVTWEKPAAAFININENWTIKKVIKDASYTVTFRVGTSVISSQTVTHGKYPNLPNESLLSIEGQIFQYWKISEQKVEDVTAYKITANTDFVAHYIKEEYEVYFFLDKNQTSEWKKILVKYDSVIDQTIEEPRQEGYSFKGWLFTKDNVEQYWNWGNKIKSSMVFYADFETILFNVRFMNYDVQVYLDRTPYNASPYININDSEIIELLKKEGHTFIGWKYGEQIITDLNSIKILSHTNLYAEYEVNIYTVAFDTAGGNQIISSQDVLFDKNVIKPQNPTKDNSSFVGWYKGDKINNNIVYKEKFDFNNERISANITLYAKWESNITATDGVQYQLNGQKTAYEVVGYTEELVDSTVKINNFINELPVESISIGAFRGNTFIIEVVLPNTIINIAPNSFEGCVALEKINITENIVTIGESAFANCISLHLVIINSGSALKEISSLAFSNCIKIENILLPNTLADIGMSAFDGCISLKSLELGENVVNIDATAFANSVRLTFVKLNSNLPPRLGTNVFINVSDNFKLYVKNPENYLSATSPFKPYSDIIYPIDCIDDTNNFTYKTLENGDNIISQYIGADKKVLLPNKIIVNGNEIVIDGIGENVININVTELKISGGLYVSANALASAKLLERLELETANNGMLTVDGALIFKEISHLPNLNMLIVPNINKITEIFGGNKLTANIKYLYVKGNAILDNMFEYCSLLEAIYLDDSVTTIGDRSFANLSGLKGIHSVKNDVVVENTLPSSLTSIGNQAFYNCSSLTIVNMADNVVAIGDRAFERCLNIKNIVLSHNEDLIIGKSILKDTKSLASLNIKFIGEKATQPQYQFIGYLFGAENYITQVSSVPVTLKTINVAEAILNAEDKANAIFGLDNITINFPI